MNFGQNLYNCFLLNEQSLVLIATVIISVHVGVKRELSKFIVFFVVTLIAVWLVFNTAGVKDILLKLFN